MSDVEVSNIRPLDEYNKQLDIIKTLRKDDFLSLLVTQLANQNPLEPTTDTQFIAQLAQFSQLEQIESLNSSALGSQALSLVGKYVFAQKQGEELVFGKVDGVINDKGEQYLVIANEYYKLSDVQGVQDYADGDIAFAANLIGKCIAFNYVEDGEAQTLTGVVEKITIENGAIFALAAGKSIPLNSIKEIYQTEEV